MQQIIKKNIAEYQTILTLVLQDQSLMQQIEEVARLMIGALHNGGAVYYCGNGGSAAEAQHLAAELSGKFLIDRKPLRAEALHVNTSFLTAVGNDYGYAHVYARAIEAKGKPGDVLILLTTSGRSANILQAALQAKEMNISTVVIMGNNESDLDTICDHVIHIPSSQTPRIQEMSLLIGHILCEWVEKMLATP